MKFLCIDPGWPPGTPPDEFVADWDGVRFVARPEMFDTVAHYLNLGKLVQLVYTTQSGPPEQYSAWFATEDPGLAEWFGSVASWVIGNEPDGAPPYSMVQTTEEFMQFWGDASLFLHGPKYIAGMCSGDVGLAATYQQHAHGAAGLMVHLYGLSPVEAYQKVMEYQDLGLPVWIGEWHHANGYSRQDYDWVWASTGGVWTNFFCYSDAMHQGFGLVP